MKKHCFWERLGPKLPRYYVQIMTVIVLCACMVTPAFAVDDMWTVANRIIVDVYNKIAGVSTVLAGLMSAVAVVGAKISNNQHKVDQSWDWLKRILGRSWPMSDRSLTASTPFNNRRMANERILRRIIRRCGKVVWRGRYAAWRGGGRNPCGICNSVSIKHQEAA